MTMEEFLDSICMYYIPKKIILYMDMYLNIILFYDNSYQNIKFMKQYSFRKIKIHKKIFDIINNFLNQGVYFEIRFYDT